MINSTLSAKLNTFRQTGLEHGAIGRGAIGSMIALTVLADYLFFGQTVGWTAAIFAFCLLSAATALNRHRLASRAGKIIFTLNLGLIAALIEYPSPLALSLFAVGLIAFLISGDAEIVADVERFTQSLMRFVRRGLVQPIDDMLNWVAAGTATSHFDRVIRAGRHWVLPALATGLFALIFSSANPVLSSWMSSVLGSGLLQIPSPLRLAFWVATAFALWPLLVVRALPPVALRSANTQEQWVATAWIGWLFSNEAVLRSLVACNVVFGLQNVLDLRFLWTGAILPEGLSFATYAHRGAYPLMAAALISAAFVLVAFAPARETSAPPLARRLMYLWIAQNVFIVLSAIRRLMLYVDVYALTYLRLAALVWMGLIAVGLIWLIVRFVYAKTNRWLVNVNAATVAVVLYAFAFIDSGAIIADYNVRHCSHFQPESAALDRDYLHSIGPSAYPALRWYIDASGATEASDPLVHRYAQNFRIQLASSMYDWRRWTYRGHRYLKAAATVPLTSSPPEAPSSPSPADAAR